MGSNQTRGVIGCNDVNQSRLNSIEGQCHFLGHAWKHQTLKRLLGGHLSRTGD